MLLPGRAEVHMTMIVSGMDGGAPVPAGGDAERILALLYAGAQLPCLVGCGGRSEVIRIGHGDDGCGEVWLECANCALRHRYAVPAATASEREQVERTIARGGDPLCPRHAGRAPLQRRGRQWVCSECGVRFLG